MKHKYDIKLSDGDEVSYISDLPLEDFKKYISSNDFLEIERSGKEPYGMGGWRRVPKLASYQTKSFVYIEEYQDYEKLVKEQKEYMDRKRSIVTDIFKYVPNNRMKIWMYFNISPRYRIENDEDLIDLPESALLEIRRRLEKFECKTKY